MCLFVTDGVYSMSIDDAYPLRAHPCHSTILHSLLPLKKPFNIHPEKRKTRQKRGKHDVQNVQNGRGTPTDVIQTNAVVIERDSQIFGVDSSGEVKPWVTRDSECGASGLDRTGRVYTHSTF